MTLSGFVAMEYYWLILNRTFLVFMAPEGLYGWKVSGPVTAYDHRYFKEYEKILHEMLNDRELMQSRDGVMELSQQRGGFFIPRADVVSVDPIYEQKWGMGGIEHSGRVRIRMMQGKSREFILLGNVAVDSIQRRIMGL